MHEIQNIYKKIKPQIKAKLREFKNIRREASEEDIFGELVFCLLTPQSKARACWRAVERLIVGNAYMRSDARQIEKCLTGVRFHRNKTRYIIEAREKFTTLKLEAVQKGCLKGQTLHSLLCNIRPDGGWTTFLDSPVGVGVTREYLVKNIKGLGYKEASHFLRNIGFGADLAILDRHILKNLKKYGVIKEIPKTITPKKYLAIEEKMKRFAKKIKIPLSHLDFVFWYNETGEVFK